MTDGLLDRLVPALAQVRGIVAVVLGGSRARGTATEQSDYDVGLYYHPDSPFEVAELKSAVAPIADEGDAVELTQIGGWGPWINGGAWIKVGGVQVDLLYRDLAALEATIAGAERGEFSIAYQAGHPHMFSNIIWMGELALALPLSDRSGLIERLKARVRPYPEPLRRAVMRRFSWEARFALENAGKAISRGDRTYVAGCAFRVLCSLAQVLFALNGRYLINEKGALHEAAALPLTVPNLEATAVAVWNAIGEDDPAGALLVLDILLRDLEELTRSAMGEQP